MMRSLGFTWLDLIALIWFFVWWLGYARFAMPGNFWQENRTATVDHPLRAAMNP